MVDVESIYSSLLPGNGFKMDTKTSKYWTNAIAKGDKTTEDFRDYVVRSQDYTNYVRSTFVDVYYELAQCISDRTDVHVLFEEMMKAKEGSIVSRADIKQYIAHTSDFRQGLQNEIVRLYRTLHGTAPEDAIIKGYEDQFLNDTTGIYSLEQLEHDIANHQQHQQANLPFQQNDNQTMTTSEPAAASQQQPSVLNPGNINLIEAFESAVKRNMSAREYLLFSNDLSNAKDKHALARTIDDQIQKHFVQVQDTVHKFLDVSIDRDAFITNHIIPAFQTENYGSILQTELVLSDLYEKKMTNKIKQLHDTMYGEEMLEEDCAYLFNRIRDMQLGIMNEDLNRLIAEFKKETDEIVQRVFDIYMEVYEREPEDDELNMHVTFMRMTTDTEVAVATIKNDLRHALEYHDVLKKRIKKAYVAVHGSQAHPISQSQVFKVLEKILVYKARDDIDALISEFV